MSAVAYIVDDLFSDRELEWVIEAAEVASSRVDRDGATVGSLEPNETAGLHYKVATGTKLVQAMPLLTKIYSALREEFSKSVGPLDCVQDADSAINVNTLEVGERYEKHVDSWDFTAVVFLTECEGGELVVYTKDGPIKLVPIRGLSIIFEGKRVPHEVLPVLSGSRKTLLFAFAREGTWQRREPGLSGALYGTEH